MAFVAQSLGQLYQPADLATAGPCTAGADRQRRTRRSRIQFHRAGVGGVVIGDMVARCGMDCETNSNNVCHVSGRLGSVRLELVVRDRPLGMDLDRRRSGGLDEPLQSAGLVTAVLVGILLERVADDVSVSGGEVGSRTPHHGESW